MKDKTIAFIAGDLSVTLFQLFIGDIWHELGDFGIKVGVTIILGIAGGMAGMIGRDLYQIIKNKKAKS